MARNVVRHDFSNIAGGTAKQNLAGPVIGEIGSLLTETDIPELAEPLKNKPHGLAELNEQFKPATFDIQAEAFNAGPLQEITGLPERPPRPQPSIQKPPAGESGTGNPYGPQNNPHSFLFVNTPQEEQAPPARPSQYNALPGMYTPYGVERTLGQDSPIQRNSPFKRVSAVRFKQEEATQAKGPGYLGASKTIRGAANAGYNAVVDRHNYKREVWAQKAAEADEEMGKLQVEESGVTTWDASVENMAREWKGELGDLLKNKESLDPNEFVAKKQEILARSAQFSKASQSLQKVVADYNENLDNISTSTDPETLDLLNTLNKGGGTLGVSNINGTPMLAGTTLGGKEVSVPISEIAAGRNAFRFNVQGDVQGNLDKVVSGLGKFKRDRETAQGLVSGSIGWDALADTAGSQVDAMLKGNASVRSILADKFGYDHDDYTQQFGQDGDAAREFAKELLMEDLQNQFQPVEQSFSIKQRGDVQAINQQRGAQARSANALANKREGEAQAAQETQVVSDYSDSIKEQGFEAAYKDGKYYRRKIGSDEYDTYNTLEELQNSPLKRNSPFRRLVNWMKK